MLFYSYSAGFFSSEDYFTVYYYIDAGGKKTHLYTIIYTYSLSLNNTCQRCGINLKAQKIWHIFYYLVF